MSYPINPVIENHPIRTTFYVLPYNPALYTPNPIHPLPYKSLPYKPHPISPLPYTPLPYTPPTPQSGDDTSNKWYQLKDKKLQRRAKGALLIKTEVVYNIVSSKDSRLVKAFNGDYLLCELDYEISSCTLL